MNPTPEGNPEAVCYSLPSRPRPGMRRSQPTTPGSCSCFLLILVLLGLAGAGGYYAYITFVLEKDDTNVTSTTRPEDFLSLPTPESGGIEEEPKYDDDIADEDNNVARDMRKRDEFAEKRKPERYPQEFGALRSRSDELERDEEATMEQATDH
ncbi:unnamed protein product [Heligmosomoides polygyrus]|uniref:FAM176 domain-containing protein n=1 Tax=Heligmosomoides polygyrus TaxID=6339 RepID=A0A183G8M9_HELPZ|nr:unnamed protein product [Heligmosomoides polygyrus]